MGKRYLIATMLLFLLLPLSAAGAPSQVRISIFNFGTTSLEASGLGATVTNMLIGQLGEGGTLAILDRKELEMFLSLNDLQQNDNLDNVVTIGSRLGLNAIVVGTVDKRGTMITVQSRVIQIDQKKAILTARASAIGEAVLAQELRKLSLQIRAAIVQSVEQQASTADASLPVPRGVTRRPGNHSIQLNWEGASGTAVAGYEVFRADSAAGPFSRLGQTNRPEYLDEGVEKDTPYFYKIRAYNDRGLQSDFSAVVQARTALTPNPPVILKAEARIKAIDLLWSPGPRSEDPEPLKGYRLYRSKTEQGPYGELATLESQGAAEVTAVLDRLLKVSYLDKGLEDGQEYHYRITAYNRKGLESGFSRSVKGSTIPPVAAVKAEGNLIREIRLTWSAIDSAAIRAYHVYRSSPGKEGFTRIKRVDIPPTGGQAGRRIEFSDSDGLADLTRYEYRITAVEEGDAETAPSPTVSALTRGRPAKLEAFKAEGGLVKRIELSWKPSTAEDVEGYKIFWSKTREGEYQHLRTLAGRMTDRYTDSSRGFDKLEDGTSYYYRMVTYNRVDVDSEATPVVMATTKPRPLPPSGLAGQAFQVKNVPLRWSANPEKDIVAYHVFRSASAEGAEFERVAKVQGMEYRDRGLRDNVLYRYRLQAEDKDGLLSDFSAVVEVSTKPRPVKIQATGVVRGGMAVLSWKASPEPDIAHYTVYENKFFGAEKINAVQETSFSEAAPPKGKTKSYVVTATDKDGLESEPGAEVILTGT